MIEVIETRYGIKYFLGDEIYRANGPAFISKDGNWEWCLFGAWHRYYGPAVNFGSLTPHGLHWYFRGKLIK